MNTLLKAAQHLDENYQIIIGGKGPLMESLTNLIAELGVQDRSNTIRVCRR